MGKQSKIFAVNRQKNIAEYVNLHKNVTVPELVRFCGVSPATIRNDLNELAGAGFVKRTHGGAVSVNTSLCGSSGEPRTEEKNDSKAFMHTEEKAAIAQRALDFIHEGDNIMLDAGTTTLQLAMLLGRFHYINVITYDLDIAHYLAHNTDCNVYLAGGHIRAGLFYCDSLDTVELLKRFKVDYSFVSSNGVSLRDGLTSASPETMGIKRIMLENSLHSILLADSSKLDKTSFFRFADLDAAEILITDPGADPSFIQSAKIAGINVITE